MLTALSYLLLSFALVMRHGHFHCCGGGIARGISTLDMDGVQPSVADSSTFSPKLDGKVTGELPIGLCVAVARAVDGLIAGNVHYLANVGWVAVVLSVHRYRDLYHLIVWRP